MRRARAVREPLADRVFAAFNRVFLGALLLVVLYPLVYLASASLSDPVAVASGRMWLWPVDVTFGGYARTLRNPDLWRGLRNTAFYTVLGTLINLAVTLPAAYALSRRDLPGRNVITGFFVLTLFVDGGLVPRYLLVRQLGLLDTVWALVLPGAASAWLIVVARSFFQTGVPGELQEAAELEGCSAFRFFWKVVLPLSKPITAVLALFYAVGHWNGYFGALIYLTDRDLYPLQLVLREILVQGELSAAVMTGDATSVAEQVRLAGVVRYAVMIVSALPLLLVYPFVQRYFVKGVLVGSLKG